MQSRREGGRVYTASSELRDTALPAMLDDTGWPSEPFDCSSNGDSVLFLDCPDVTVLRVSDVDGDGSMHQDRLKLPDGTGFHSWLSPLVDGHTVAIGWLDERDWNSYVSIWQR
jgi:hypothetical protein